MNTQEIRKIGVDPGFSSIKVAEVQGERIASFLLPSAVGAGADTESGLSITGLGLRRQTGPKPQQVQFDGYEYLVGNGVADFTEPLYRMDFNRFTDSPELRASLYAALYQLLNGGGHTIALAVALPVSVLQNKDEADRVEKSMRGWMVGRHNFLVNGVDTHVNVTAVRAKIPQPVASWMEWGLNNHGQWTKGHDVLTSDTLVVDQGFNTLDVLVVQNGQISQRHTGGDTLGMSRAAQNLKDSLYRRFRMRCDLMECNDLIWQVTKGQQATISLNGEKENITQQVKQAITSLEADVIQFLKEVIRTQAGYRVLLTGGGALSMATRLTQVFPKATMLHEPVLANARGLAKMAQRPGFLE